MPKKRVPVKEKVYDAASGKAKSTLRFEQQDKGPPSLKPSPASRPLSEALDVYKRQVVGRVESCEPIPETHLHVCQVNAGEHGTMQICCGADNVRCLLYTSRCV